MLVLYAYSINTMAGKIDSHTDSRIQIDTQKDGYIYKKQTNRRIDIQTDRQKVRIGLIIGMDIIRTYIHS